MTRVDWRFRPDGTYGPGVVDNGQILDDSEAST
jgi:hypothetical protein